mmetsp:Transcript_3737/g.7202  ORF Transcript_3737/g.7202 Transcript_3737/m.7202 type:complete len:203 (-) Transcript_3737:223-831(-)
MQKVRQPETGARSPLQRVRPVYPEDGPPLPLGGQLRRVPQLQVLCALPRLCHDHNSLCHGDAVFRVGSPREQGPWLVGESDCGQPRPPGPLRAVRELPVHKPLPVRVSEPDDAGGHEGNRQIKVRPGMLRKHEKRHGGLRAAVVLAVCVGCDVLRRGALGWPHACRQQLGVIIDQIDPVDDDGARGACLRRSIDRDHQDTIR